MELLSQEEIGTIAKALNSDKVINWSIENYADKLIGYLGDHLRLKISLESNDNDGIHEEQLFVKCMPRFDKWKSGYLEELNFFRKEFVMLTSLFKQFKSNEGSKKWRPKLLFARNDLFVFENVDLLGYKMPCQLDTLSHYGIMATVDAIAKFHAQSFIFEENKSKHFGRPYRIWEDYKEYLQEPTEGQDWRDTGRNAVIDYLKVYSKYINRPNFYKHLEIVIPMLYDGAFSLMKPSTTYRNAVVHRDLWSNNIFLKEQEECKLHALIVDFQTVLYCSPMLDLSSLMFFNTTRKYREEHLSEALDLYYTVLSEELKSEGIEVDTIIDRTTLDKAYDDSIMFGITQAAIIVPIVCMSADKREELFCSPETSVKINVVSRSKEFIEIAKEDENYRNRVTELLDEIVERYIYAENSLLN